MKKQLTKMDFWVLAVVLALIAGVFVKGRVMRRLPEISSFTYQMELTEVEGDIAPGDTVLCLAGKQPIGTVTEVQTEGDRLILTLQAEGFPIEGGWRYNLGGQGILDSRYQLLRLQIGYNTQDYSQWPRGELKEEITYESTGIIPES